MDAEEVKLAYFIDFSGLGTNLLRPRCGLGDGSSIWFEMLRF